MLAKRIGVFCTVSLFCLLAITACTPPVSHSNPAPGKPGAPGSATRTSPTSTVSPRVTTTGKPGDTPTPVPSGETIPTHYATRLLLTGKYRPDDLVFDPAGRLVFSDFYAGTVNRLNANGSVTVLISGMAGPEGMVYLPDGTLIIAEQQTNRIMAFSPETLSLTVLRVLPGRPSKLPCKDGVDGIALDLLTHTLIVSDSPIGTVYRMSLDGKKLSVLATQITRPVGAAVDSQGNVYVADECGGALWRIATSGVITRIGGFGMLDDVAFDSQGNILVIDLKPSIHALIRVRLATGRREVLASRGFIEPQGLVVDAHDDIYVSDDYANKIVEYIPV